MNFEMWLAWFQLRDSAKLTKIKHLRVTVDTSMMTRSYTIQLKALRRKDQTHMRTAVYIAAVVSQHGELDVLTWHTPTRSYIRVALRTENYKFPGLAKFSDELLTSYAVQPTRTSVLDLWNHETHLLSMNDRVKRWALEDVRNWREYNPISSAPFEKRDIQHPNLPPLQQLPSEPAHPDTLDSMRYCWEKISRRLSKPAAFGSPALPWPAESDSQVPPELTPIPDYAKLEIGAFARLHPSSSPSFPVQDFGRTPRVKLKMLTWDIEPVREALVADTAFMEKLAAEMWNAANLTQKLSVTRFLPPDVWWRAFAFVFSRMSPCRWQDSWLAVRTGSPMDYLPTPRPRPIRKVLPSTRPERPGVFLSREPDYAKLDTSGFPGLASWMMGVPQNNRGMCAYYTKQLCLRWPSLRHVRGWCNGIEHHWAVAPDGTIVDPTASQFGEGVRAYKEFVPGDYVRIGRCHICGSDIYRRMWSLERAVRVNCIPCERGES